MVPRWVGTQHHQGTHCLNLQTAKTLLAAALSKLGSYVASDMTDLDTKTQIGFERPAERLGYMPGIDGLRAVAVTLVLLFHADFPWMQGGFLGVSIFFTLSGFLITAVLLREWWSTSTLDGRGFWTRRLRRLTPAAWAVLAGIVLLGVLRVWDDTQLRDLRTDLPWSIADLLNWHFIRVGNSYGDSFSAPSPVEHFWSLAVETQFYALLLILLAVVLFLGRTTPRRVRLNRLITTLLAATVLSATANLLLARNSLDRAYFGTDTRAAEMLIGALLACFTVRTLQLSTRTARKLLSGAGLLAAATLLLLSFQARLDSTWLYPWGLLLTALCTAAVIGSVMQGDAIARALQVRVLVELGKISYGVYLIHWPIFLWLTPQRTSLGLWPLFALRMAIVIPLAVLLFRFVESPIRTGAGFRRPRAVLAVPLAAALLVIGGFGISKGLGPAPEFLQERAMGEISTASPALKSSGRLAASSPTTLPEVAASVQVQPATQMLAPQPRFPLRVLLVGDSVAASLQDALAQSLTDRGIAFGSVATPGCGVIVGVPGSGVDKPIKLSGNVIVAECENSIPQRQNESIAQFKPDLVISMSVWEGISRTVNGVWYRFGTTESDSMLSQLFAETHDRMTAQGAALAWVLMPDTVAGRNTPPGRPTQQDFSSTSHLRELLNQFSTQQSSTTVIDFASIVCPELPCPKTLAGHRLRPMDGLHFEDPEGASYVAEQLADLISKLDLQQITQG